MNLAKTTATTSTALSAILLCGGVGSRMGNQETPKQFILFKGKPIALYSYELLCTLEQIKEIVVVCKENYRHLFEQKTSGPKLLFAEPGIKRQDSVKNGLSFLGPNCELVLVHDSARPFLTREQVIKTIESASLEVASALGVKTKATVRHCDEKGNVIHTPKRELVWEMQTPQIVAKTTLLKGFEIAAINQLEVTDDIALAELAGHPVRIVEGGYQNIKITTNEDLAIAEVLYRDSAI